MGLFDALDNASGSKDAKILRAPFAYPGGKSKSLKQILPHLPYRQKYIEPFGGSGAVMLARNPSKLEVFNDRFAGVVAFYRCLKDVSLYQQLIDWLELTVHSREEFHWCKTTWQNVDDPVERAGRWYYMMEASFGSIGRTWGRQVAGSSMAGKIQNKLPMFQQIHNRFKKIQIENLDWQQCISDYDSEDAVIYCDPPYMDAYRGTYKNEMTPDDHKNFLKTVFKCRGFVAVSGYSNPVYEDNPWDARYEWKAFVSIQSVVGTVGNGKLDIVEERGHATEVLWVKG